MPKETPTSFLKPAMPTSPNFAFSSLLHFWRNPIFHPANGERSAQKSPLATNNRGRFDDKENGPPPRGPQSRRNIPEAERGHKENRHSKASDNPPSLLPSEEEKASLNSFARDFRRQMEKLSDVPSTPPCQMETILETSEDPEGSDVETRREFCCESVYHTPTSLEFNSSDIPQFLTFTSDISPQANEPLTREASSLRMETSSLRMETSSLRMEISSLREELEEARREYQDLDAGLVERYDFKKSVRELESGYERLLEEELKFNKKRRTLAQNMASMTDDLRTTKHSHMMLEREADQLRWIIHYYQLSIQQVGISLPYQIEIDKRVSSLDYPLQPPPIASYQAGDVGQLPTIAESSEDPSAGSTPFRQKANYFATPPRTPNSQRVKSSIPVVFPPSAKLLRPESPVKRDYVPREGSPLRLESRLWSTDEVGDTGGRWPHSTIPSDGRTSRLDYTGDD